MMHFLIIYIIQIKNNCYKLYMSLLLAVPLWHPEDDPAAETSYWNRVKGSCGTATSQIRSWGFGLAVARTSGSCRCLETP